MTTMSPPSSSPAKRITTPYGLPYCECACCQYDAAARARAQAGKPAHEPGVEPYTARQVLECAVFRYGVSPSHHLSQESRDWWRLHEPAVFAWLEEEVDAGLEDPEQAKFAATLLLAVPTDRVPRADPRVDPPPPYSWVGIDAYEILFEHVLLGGLPDYFDYEVLLPAMRRFATFLRRHGLIPVELGIALDCDFEGWIPKAVMAAKGCVWWSRDGRMVRHGSKVA